MTVANLGFYLEEARGCDQSDVYAYDHGQNRWSSLRQRAAFELDCKPEELRVTVLDSRTYGVSGCEQRLVYKMVPYTGFVLDTASGEAQ